MPVCRLCLKEKRLIRAHVIPQPFWPNEMSGGGVAKIISNTSGHYPKKSRTGEYDNTILCGRCDGFLGILDQHAAEKLLNGTAVEAVVHRGLTVRQYPDAVPETVHRFIASVFWRASVSSRKFFGRVQLGPYEEAIRAALFSNGSIPDNIQSMVE